METLLDLIDWILHLDEHLQRLTRQHGGWVYALLFVIIFCETGLVVTPFLPGDSLLFTVGALAAHPFGGIDPWAAGGLMVTAAILGDSMNYALGRLVGEQALRRFPRIIKPVYLERTNAFFLRYGGKTIMLARFVPLLRTFAPFIAGSGAMPYRRFMLFNVAGALLWVGLILPAGFLFGNIPLVERHFHLVLVGVLGVSLMPLAFEVARARVLGRPA